MNVGSLFAGIGGFDLGFERVGMRTLWFCEQDPYCRRVLAKHWPGVPCHSDVRALVAYPRSVAWERRQDCPTINGAGGEEAQRCKGFHQSARGGDLPSRSLPVPVPYVDVLCGGFPCQDISLAGKGAGIEGSRSGLWREFARLIGELRPRYVVVENVPALASRGLDRVLADLAACGFDAEWDHLPASAFGAPHRRDRLWLVAYANRSGRNGWTTGHTESRQTARAEPGLAELCAGDADSYEHPQDGTAIPWGHWLSEPDVGRVAHGVPNRVHRLRALGNSLVPQIAQWIGERIVSYELAQNERTPAPTGVQNNQIGAS